MEEKVYEQERIFFVPGDKVKVNKLSNSPEMYVVRKKEITFKDGEEKNKTLQGMICRWFTTDGQLQEAVFNTKDLIKL